MNENKQDEVQLGRVYPLRPSGLVRPPVRVVDAVVVRRAAKREPSWSVRRLLGALAVLAGLALAAGFVWLVVQAVVSLLATLAIAVAWVHANWVWLALITAGAAWLLLAGGGRCGGMHCRGCRR